MNPKTKTPLGKITVLDLSRLYPGGFCSLLLADLGATIIKIEEPGVGDFYRAATTGTLLGQGHFEALNRGKQSLSLNLKTAAGRKILLRLVQEADVVLESFRPGRLKKLGLDYANLKKENPRLILCSITGYGQTGPQAQRAGHDLNYLSDAGLLGMSGSAGKKPPVPGFQVADLAGGGLYGATAILAALYQRDQTQKGTWIDLSMTEGVASLIGTHFVAGQRERPKKGRGEHLLDGGAASYNVYETKEGAYLALAALEPKFWKIFCRLTGLKVGKSGFSPEVFTARVRRQVERLIRTHPLRVWQRWAVRYDFCLTPIRSLRQLLVDPHLKARQFFFKGKDLAGKTVHYMKSPLLFNRRRFFRSEPPPQYGEQTTKILRRLGYKAAEIRRLRDEGVI